MRAVLLSVRRERAIDAMAVGVRSSSRGENAPSGQCGAAPDPGRPLTRQRARSQPAFVSSAREEGVVSFQLAGLPILSGPAALGRVALESVVCQRRAQTAAEYPVRLGAQELRPGGADAPRCRPHARLAQHGGDRSGGDADAELEQLTLDTYVAPARVLSRQSLDQAARLGRKRGTTGHAAAFPTSLQQCAVPAAKRLRAHRKAGPRCGREQPARGSEQGAVGGRVPRPLSSSPEDRELVAQDHDLKLTLTPAAGEQANDAAQQPVQQTRQHDAQS